MARVDDVEIFADDGSAVVSAEDSVDIEPRPVPRWAKVAGGALVAAVFIGVVASSHPKPARKQSAPAVVVTAGPSVDGGFGPAPHLEGAADARAALVHRNQLFVLRSGRVSVVDLAAGHATTMPLTGAYSVPAAVPTRLLFDANVDRLWVVAMGPQIVQVVELNTDTRLPVRRLTLRLAVRDAAEMDGHVYLATSTGLADLAPGATHADALPGAHGTITAIAADPTRERIVALDSGNAGTVVVAVSTHGAVSRRAFGNLANGSIAVVGDAIWIAGYDVASVVARLDAETLAAVQLSPVTPSGDRIVISPGTDVVWVGGAGPGLWCLDPGTGRVLQTWLTAQAPVTSQRGRGPVQSRIGRAYAVDAGRLVSLSLVGCTG